MAAVKEVIRYEDGAEQRTVTGWCCKKCGHFWGVDEHMAKWCCATELPCKGCENRVSKNSFTHCDSCRAKNTRERFEKLEAKPYDGSAVVTYDNDLYFFDQDSLLEYLADRCAAPEDFPLGDVMLVFAENRKPNWRSSVSEILCDELAEDEEWDTREIDEQIEAWVTSNAPSVYWPTKVRVDQASIVALVEAEKTAGNWPE